MALTNLWEGVDFTSMYKLWAFKYIGFYQINKMSGFLPIYIMYILSVPKILTVIFLCTLAGPVRPEARSTMVLDHVPFPAGGAILVLWGAGSPPGTLKDLVDSLQDRVGLTGRVQVENIDRLILCKFPGRQITFSQLLWIPEMSGRV